MNKREARLKRLFDTARLVPERDGPALMPRHLQTRILAHWRATHAVSAAEQARLLIAALFRRALVGAAVLMLASIAWSLGTEEPDGEDDEAAANYAFRVDVMP